MAKDVDLTSREWCEIVFEGKNKDFGAYKLRESSPARHTKAIVSVLIALAIILTLLILSVNGVFNKPEEEQMAISTEQEIATFDAEEEEIEEEEEEQFQMPEPEEIIAPEEVANLGTVAAIQLARSKGAFVYGICNVVGASIPRNTDSGTYIHVGPEIGVASTKAFTGQVTVLMLLDRKSVV